MDCKDIKEIISAIDNSTITELELNIDNIHLKLNKSISSTQARTNFFANENYEKIELPNYYNAEKHVESNDNHVIKSPIVGTFYTKPSPDKPSYVEKGSIVSKGDILCIVEAMKVMNEITSDIDGKVLQILAINEQMVEYSQPLFILSKE